MTIEAQLMWQARITCSLPWLQRCLQSKTTLLKVHWRLWKLFGSRPLAAWSRISVKAADTVAISVPSVLWQSAWGGKKWEEVTLPFETPFPWQDGWNFASSSVLKNYSLESWRWQETSRILPVCIELPETVLFGKVVHTISRKLCFCYKSLLKAAGMLLHVVYFGKWNLNVAFPQWQSYAMQSNTSGNLCHICVLTANKGMQDDYKLCRYNHFTKLHKRI